LAIVHQYLTQLDAFRFVDVENCDRSSSGLSPAYKDGSVPLEVPFPGLASWVKEPDNLLRQGISP
jgi:hypothetical protein